MTYLGIKNQIYKTTNLNILFNLNINKQSIRNYYNRLYSSQLENNKNEIL